MTNVLQSLSLSLSLKNLRRVQTRKMELENMVQEIEQRLEEEMERSNGWTTERKQLEQKLQDITEQYVTHLTGRSHHREHF